MREALSLEIKFAGMKKRQLLSFYEIYYTYFEKILKV